MELGRGRFLILYKHFYEIFGYFSIVLPGIKYGDEVLVVRLMQTIVLIQFIKWFCLVYAILILRTAHIVVQGETKKLAVGRFLERKWVKTTQNRARFVDAAIACFLVEKMAALMVATKGHEEALVTDFQPGGVIFVHTGDFVGGQEFEKIIGVDPLHPDDSNYVPRRGKAYNFRTTMATMVAGETYTV